MSIEEFYNTLKNKENNELNQLYKKPVPEVGIYMPKAQIFKKDIYYQADCLYMPEDNKFKYMLVCCDMYDGTLDAEPLKEITPDSILIAFKEIFKRNYLNYPIYITFDKGNEFKGINIQNYFKNNGTNIKYALTGRHRQLANVERANQKIATILFKRMSSQELITGEPDKHWVDDLKPLIKVLNEHKKTPIKREINIYPIVDKYSGDLIKIGTKVRFLLDYPINTTNNARLNGNFRSSDIRWNPIIYKTTEILLKPGYPPGYLTTADDNVYRTKNQLSVVKNNEKEPDPKFIRGTPENYIISKIIDKKTKGKSIFYLVKWKGYSDKENTWEPSSILDRTNDLKEMKRNFNLNF